MVFSSSSCKLKRSSGKAQTQCPGTCCSATIRVRRPWGRGRHLYVILNPYGGGGRAVELFERCVRPVYTAAKCKFTVVHTQHAGHATELAAAVDPATVDGIVIVGGDGLVQEVVTGLQTRADGKGNIALSIVPGGTANAYAHLLYPGCASRECLARRSAVAAVSGAQRQVDILELLRPDDQPRYALSLFGWGMCGVVAAKAEGLRWLPGHRHYRYDLAGALALLRDWPVVAHAKLYVRDEGRPQPGGEFSYDAAGWREEALNAVNVMACNVPDLGRGRPVARGISLDDGFLSLSVIPEGLSKRDVVRILSGMKKGRRLQDQPGVLHRRVREFKLVPVETPGVATPEFLIDGDVFPWSPVHVKVLERLVTVMAEAPAPPPRARSLRQSLRGLVRRSLRRNPSLSKASAADTPAGTADPHWVANPLRRRTNSDCSCSTNSSSDSGTFSMLDSSQASLALPRPVYAFRSTYL